MKELGMTFFDLSDGDISPYTEGQDSCFTYPIMQYEFKHAINSYLKGRPNIPQSLAEILEYNEKHKDIALKYGQGNLIAANKISENWKNELGYLKAISQRNAAIDTLDRYFDRQDINLLMIISAHCGLAAATGFPSVTIPIGKQENGLPIGCLLMARRFDEGLLLSAAKMLEAVL
jgi:amidase